MVIPFVSVKIYLSVISNKSLGFGLFVSYNCAEMNRRDIISLTLENIVFLKLLHRGFQVTVGKAGEWEIDFFCKKQGEKRYIQVAYLLASQETIEREFGAFKDIVDNYPKYMKKRLRPAGTPPRNRIIRRSGSQLCHAGISGHDRLPCQHRRNAQRKAQYHIQRARSSSAGAK